MLLLLLYVVLLFLLHPKRFGLYYRKQNFLHLQNVYQGSPVSGKTRLRWGSDPMLIDYKFGSDVGTSGNFDLRVFSQDGCKTGMEDDCDKFLRVLMAYKRVQIGYYVQTIIPSFMLVTASFGSLMVPSDQV